jgi:choline-phosphate cytidylyltransferase
LLTIANDNNLILTEGLRTAYSTAYERLLLLVKTGKIGKVVSIDATCTSLKNFNPNDNNDLKYIWNSMTAWAPTALLPVFQILGTKYRDYKIVSHILNDKFKFDDFSQISFVYPEAVANVKVGIGVKSEGELLISGTRGYVYVPSPWWKTDYFELRYENPLNNKRYFYQLDGEGIRYELVTFLRAIEENKNSLEIENNVTMEISDIMNSFYNKINLITI